MSRMLVDVACSLCPKATLPARICSRGVPCWRRGGLISGLISERKAAAHSGVICLASEFCRCPQQAVSLICTKHCLWPEQSSCSGGLGLGFCSLVNLSTSTADSEDLVVRRCLQVRLLRTRWRAAEIRLLLNYTTAPLGARGPSVLSTLCSSCRGRFGAWSSFLVPRMSHLFVAPRA